MTAGGLFAFIALLGNFFDPVQQLSQFYQTYLSANAALDKIFDVMETPAGMTTGPTPRSWRRSWGRFPSSTSASDTPRNPRWYSTTSTSPWSLARPSRWWDIPAPASRRW